MPTARCTLKSIFTFGYQCKPHSSRLGVHLKLASASVREWGCTGKARVGWYGCYMSDVGLVAAGARGRANCHDQCGPNASLSTAAVSKRRDALVGVIWQRCLHQQAVVGARAAYEGGGK